MANNTEFYNRILNGTETKDDIVQFNAMCESYSDMYKDIYGFRPRNENTMCVNAYSGNPNLEEFRNLLKEGFNPLADLEREYDDYIEEENDWVEECIERDFIESNPSKEEILNKHPEYEKYFA